MLVVCARAIKKAVVITCYCTSDVVIEYVGIQITIDFLQNYF